MKINKLLALLAGGVISFGLANGSVTLVSNNFDGDASNDLGSAFQEVSNGVGNVGANSDVNTGVIDTGNNNGSTRGFNNTELTNINLVSGATGFTATYVIDSVSNAAAIERNGFFLGIVTGTDATGTGSDALFNNNPLSLGIRLQNSGANTSGNSPYRFVIDQQGANGAQINNALFIAAGGGAPTPSIASLEDGFTLTLTVNNDNTWSASSTGLDVNISAGGNLNPSLAAYSDFAGGLGLYASTQGNQTAVNIGSISLTASIPEPTTTTLLGLSGLALLLRRKRA